MRQSKLKKCHGENGYEGSASYRWVQASMHQFRSRNENMISPFTIISAVNMDEKCEADGPGDEENINENPPPLNNQDDPSEDSQSSGPVDEEHLVSDNVMDGEETGAPAEPDKDVAAASESRDDGFKMPEKSITANDKNKPGTSKQPPVKVKIGPSPKPNTFQNKTHKLSPAQQIQSQNIPLPYKEPEWGALSEVKYKFEVLKSGKIIDNIDLSSKSFYVFGRLPSCDITMDHPSLSRYHAIVQYCGVQNERKDKGWYLYDLDSTHGTIVNKVKAKPRVYQRLHVGHVVKFGGSTRLHILQVCQIFLSFLKQNSLCTLYWVNTCVMKQL